MSSHRPDRLASVIRTASARLLTQIPPDVAMAASVTDVEVQPDFSSAKVYVGAIKNPEAAIGFLKRHIPDLRKELAAQLKTFRIPRLLFMLDERAARGERIERMLRKEKN